MPLSTSIYTPLDFQLDAYRNSQTLQNALPTETRKWLEEAVIVGADVYEMLDRRHRLFEGLESLRRRSGTEAEEAMRRLREWLTVTRNIVLHFVDQVEQVEGFNAVGTTQHLRPYIERADGLLKEWDATVTQANVCWRETELTPEEGNTVAEIVREGRAKAKFKRPNLTSPQ